MPIQRVTVAGELYGVERWANVFHISTVGAPDNAAIATLFENAYETDASGGGKGWLYGCPGDITVSVVGVHMSTIQIQAVVDPGVAYVKNVNHQGKQNTPGGLPVDVSLCVSWQTAKAGRSYRGRTYLPPIHENQNDDSDGSMPHPSATLLSGYAVNAAHLVAALADMASPLVVYSRVHSSGQEITGGYIDNEYDTQRRRSNKQPRTKHTF